MLCKIKRIYIIIREHIKRNIKRNKIMRRKMKKNNRKNILKQTIAKFIFFKQAIGKYCKAKENSVENWMGNNCCQFEQCKQ